MGLVTLRRLDPGSYANGAGLDIPSSELRSAASPSAARLRGLASRGAVSAGGRCALSTLSTTSGSGRLFLGRPLFLLTALVVIGPGVRPGVCPGLPLLGVALCSWMSDLRGRPLRFFADSCDTSSVSFNGTLVVVVAVLNLLRAALPLLFISSSCSASTVTLIRHGLRLLSDCSFEGDKEEPCPPRAFFEGVDFIRSSSRKECVVFVGLVLGRGLLRGVWNLDLDGVYQLRRPGTGLTGAGEMR